MANPSFPDESGPEESLPLRTKETRIRDAEEIRKDFVKSTKLPSNPLVPKPEDDPEVSNG